MITLKKLLFEIILLFCLNLFADNIDNNIFIKLNKEDIIFYLKIYNKNSIVITSKGNEVPFIEFKLFYIKENEVFFNINLGLGADCHIIFDRMTVQKSIRDLCEKDFPCGFDLFVYVEGQASNVYVFNFKEDNVKVLFSNGAFRSDYDCYDIDGDGIYEIIAHETSWHARSIIIETKKKWQKILKKYENVKIIYKFSQENENYYLYDIVPDVESEVKIKNK